MAEWLKNLFVSIFGGHSEIATLIISMIPIVELRGAIPFGSATSFWGEAALPLWESFLISLAGSSFVCIVLTFLFQPIFNWLKRTKAFKKLAGFIERKLKKNSKNIDEKAEAEKSAKKIFWIKIVGVFCFVALPLPLTGVWTGTCLALFVGLNRKQTLATVLLGNSVAGGLMLLISYLFAGNTMIVFYAFLILVAVFILYELIKAAVTKLMKKNAPAPAAEASVNPEQIEAQTTEKTTQQKSEKSENK